MINPFVVLPFMLLIWMYVMYPFILALLSKMRRNEVTRCPITPGVSVIICTHNESRVIDRRIENLLTQDYPREKMQIIIVDDCSTDKTREIIAKKWMDDVQLIGVEARRGKPNALNLGLGRTKHDIIILSDATPLFDRDAITNIVKNFADPTVGAVTGTYDPVGGEELYWRFRNKLRSLEGEVDSTTLMSGGLCALRKGLIETVDEDSLADDVNIAIKIRERRYRVIYDESARVTQKVASTSKGFLTQKTRRTIGGIQEMMRFKWMIFNPRFGLFGMLIMPTTFLLVVLNPPIFLLSLASFAYILLKFNPYSILSVPVLFILAISFSESFPVKTLINFVMTIYAQLLGLIKYFQRSFEVEWEQVESLRI